MIKNILTTLLLLGLISCGKECTKFHYETKTRTIKVCVQSHKEQYTTTETKWKYHWGYSIMKGKFCWHYGPTKVQVVKIRDVCDKYEDKIEIYQEKVCDEWKK